MENTFRANYWDCLAGIAMVLKGGFEGDWGFYESSFICNESLSFICNEGSSLLFVSRQTKFVFVCSLEEGIFTNH